MKRYNFCIFLLVSYYAVGCASTPPSTTLPQAEISIESINHQNYRDYASQDIDNVLSKLQLARKHQSNKQHLEAEYLSQQILADVEVIQIKVQRLILENDVTTLEQNIISLHKEIQWREPLRIKPLQD